MMRDRLIAGVWVAGPIDLIPEFLPIIGPLDDIVVVAPASRLAMPIPVTPPVSHRCCTPASVGDGGKSGSATPRSLPAIAQADGHRIAVGANQASLRYFSGSVVDARRSYLGPGEPVRPLRLRGCGLSLSRSYSSS
jgi:hypothetical protein